MSEPPRCSRRLQRQSAGVQPSDYSNLKITKPKVNTQNQQQISASSSGNTFQNIGKKVTAAVASTFKKLSPPKPKAQEIEQNQISNVTPCNPVPENNKNLPEEPSIFSNSNSPNAEPVTNDGEDTDVEDKEENNKEEEAEDNYQEAEDTEVEHLWSLLKIPDWDIPAKTEVDSTPSSPMPKMTDYTTMPKYSKPLISRDVKLFLKQYELWGNQQKLTVVAMKSALLLAFDNEDARRWFLLAHEKAVDNVTSFKEFTDLFLQQAPIQSSSSAEIYKILTELPQQHEMASSYLLRIRYRAGDDWTAENEPTFISILIDNLPKAIASFIACKDKPDNFKELLLLVREYEQQGHETTAYNTMIKKEVPVSAVSDQSHSQLNDIQSMVQVLFREVAEIKSVGSQTAPPSQQARHQQQQNHRGHGYRGRGRGSYGNTESRQCNYCFKSGHIMRDCYTRLRDMGITPPNRHRGRMFTRGRGNYQQHYQSYYQQQFPPAWPAAAPALTQYGQQQSPQHTQYYVTYPGADQTKN